MLVADGRTLPVAVISGVLNLLPFVPEFELFTIGKSDRRYVASEISAMLTYFLTEIECPVINRPSAEFLGGPGWRPEQWFLACRQAGIATRAVRRRSRAVATEVKPGDLKAVSIVGGIFAGAIGAVDLPSLAALARLANATFLTAFFECDQGVDVFHSARLTPDVGDAEVLGAIHRFFSAV